MAQPAINDITKDKIKSRPPTDKYRENYDKIFGKKKRVKRSN